MKRDNERSDVKRDNFAATAYMLLTLQLMRMLFPEVHHSESSNRR